MKLNPNGTIRHYFDPYSNMRPARTFSGVPSHVGDNADVVVFRENTEGFLLYRNMFKGYG